MAERDRGRNDSDDWEAPDAADSDGAAASVDTVACPYCGKMVYEQADICPHCHSFIAFEESRRRYPWWVLIGGLAALAAALTWMFLGW